jgi:hypothetical protein
LEHVSTAGKALYGEGPAASHTWTAQTREVLLREGYLGMQRVLAESRLIAVRGGQRSALDNLQHYLNAHSEHLDYAGRLAEGRVIGSGQVEGACKHWIGRRLKQTGARWRVDRANRMAGLCALKYSQQ